MICRGLILAREVERMRRLHQACIWGMIADALLSVTLRMQL